MKIKYRHITSMALMGILISLGISSKGQSSQIIKKIKIQEKILETIIEEDAELSLDNETGGLYLEGLGAIFTLSLDDDLDTFLDIKTLGDFNFSVGENVFAMEMDGNKIKWVTEDDDSLESDGEDKIDSLKTETENRLTELKNVLKEYIADYGPLLDLQDSEVLILKVKFEDSIIHSDDLDGFEYSIEGKLLNKARRGKLDRDKLINEIDISLIEDDINNFKDIRIMRKILNTAMSPDDKSGLGKIFHNDNRWETYIPGYGAVFFDDLSSGMHIFDGTGLWTSSGDHTVIYDDDTHKDHQKSYHENLETDIKEILATYSSTLKTVQSDERIVVAVKLDDDDSDIPQVVIYTLYKSDIDLYGDKAEKLKDKIGITKI